MDYTCRDYRQEMLLAALRKQLNEEDVSEEERNRIHREISELESAMGMD